MTAQAPVQSDKKPKEGRLLAALGLDEAGQVARLQRMALATQAAWARYGIGALGRWGAAYAETITVEEVTADRAVIVAPGSQESSDPKALRLAMLLNHGFGPGGMGTEGSVDMRRFLLAGPGVKTGKHGRYRAVPLGAPGTRSTKPLMNIRETAQGERLRRLLALRNQRSIGGGTVNPHAAHGGPMAHPPHGSQGGADKGIRTVSDAGGGWIHPGFRAVRVGLQVHRRLGRILEGLI